MRESPLVKGKLNERGRLDFDREIARKGREPEAKPEMDRQDYSIFSGKFEQPKRHLIFCLSSLAPLSRDFAVKTPRLGLLCGIERRSIQRILAVFADISSKETGSECVAEAGFQPRKNAEMRKIWNSRKAF